MARFCSSCGAPVQDGVKFCGKCGAQQQAASPVPQTATPPQQQDTALQQTSAPPQNYNPPSQAVVQQSQPPQQQGYNAPPQGYPPPQHAPRPVSRKEKTTAGILGILLGGIGAHKFYLGNTTKGIIYLLLCWTLIPGLIGLVEGIKYLTMSQEEFDAKYNNFH